MIVNTIISIKLLASTQWVGFKLIKAESLIKLKLTVTLEKKTFFVFITKCNICINPNLLLYSQFFLWFRGNRAALSPMVRDYWRPWTPSTQVHCWPLGDGDGNGGRFWNIGLRYSHLLDETQCVTPLYHFGRASPFMPKPGSPTIINKYCTI